MDGLVDRLTFESALSAGGAGAQRVPAPHSAAREGLRALVVSSDGAAGRPCRREARLRRARGQSSRQLDCGAVQEVPLLGVEPGCTSRSRLASDAPATSSHACSRDMRLWTYRRSRLISGAFAGFGQQNRALTTVGSLNGFRSSHEPRGPDREQPCPHQPRDRPADCDVECERQPALSQDRAVERGGGR